MSTKDRSIRYVVAALRLRENSWIVVDPWDADLFAIGVAHELNPRRRVYISTFKKAPGRYYFECEVPVGPEETDYSTILEGDDVEFEELERTVARHLSRPER